MQASGIKCITPAWSAHAKVTAFTTLRNETKASLAANTSQPIAWLKQTHSNNCIIVDDMNYNPEADAAINFNAKAACCVVTADCVPILLTDTTATFVAAIHAGWRGIANGVIEQTIAKLNAKNIIAWLGPCICHNCYIVQPEFKQIFTTKNTKFNNFFTENNKQDITFNLKKACKFILNSNNIIQIYETEFCTSCDNDLFFSARKEGISCGRIITCIWKNN
jgi:polyphenol oxidase